MNDLTNRFSDSNPKPFMNPYLAGIGLGLVLLISYVIMGRGLGASGAFSSLATQFVNVISPEHVSSSSFYSHYLNESENPLNNWLVYEIAGVFVGGFISGFLGKRIRKSVDKGPNISNGKRFLFAFLGGIIMGFGSKLARGCTSGQALTGGAVLNLGSWIFMISLFIGAYSVAYFVRKQWL